MSAVYHFASGSTSCHVNRHAKLVRVKKTSKSVEQPQNISTLNLMGAFRGVNMYVCMISFKRRKKNPEKTKHEGHKMSFVSGTEIDAKCCYDRKRRNFWNGTAEKRGRTLNHGAQSCAFPRRDDACRRENKKKKKITLTPGVLILMQWSLTPCRVSAPGEDWRRPAYPVNKERKEGGKK